MADKCIWCAAEDTELKTIEIEQGGKIESVQVCGDACQVEVEKFAAYADDHVPHFLAGLLGLPALGVLLLFLLRDIDGGALSLFVIFAGLGATIIKFPFATPQTVSMMGLRRAIKVVRGLGWVLIVGGVLAAVLVYIYR